ncbi:Cytochrome c552 [Achromobacter xylosoxidans]|uniref:c-type cytochrome n=1 Tax=Alcaligenes xylosoxydans xylosoxydans TaxID=85698 RepID=UPI0006BF5309|nr:c-type cytochrome [Achromobacter xylosoxidans]CUJ32598.1 Cytochrome c552 [Achromobacter xylosoxidans]
MHLIRSLLAVAAGLLVAGAAQGQTTGLDLANSKACMACHQVDVKRVGPPLASVAERYAGQGDAMVDYLAGKIRSGGRGAWGAVPMPAQTHVSPEDARLLAEWILSLAPAKK